MEGNQDEKKKIFRADAPENTRLFILAGKGIKEETFREKFEQYGKIEDLWIVKDRRTNEDKGVVYITFSKTSEAALALEEMNGKIIEGNPRPLKVMVASTKRDGSVRDPREDERLNRLFVIIPKSFTEDDLTKEFAQYGDVASVSVLRHKDSNDPKGFGFVRFHRPYHAALALENCDRSFKPKFAEPKKPASDSGDRYFRDNYNDRGSKGPGGYQFGDRDRDRGRDRGQKRGLDDYGGERDGRKDRRDDFMTDDGRSKYSAFTALNLNDDVLIGQGQALFSMIQDYPHSNCQRLHITAPLGLTQNYLHKLFNILPGLEYCDLNEQTGIAYVRYQTPQMAAYARDKLDQFEYPIGTRLIVRYADTVQQNQDLRHKFDLATTVHSAMEMLADNNAVLQAAKVLEQAGINPELVLQASADAGLERVTYCNIKLPLTKPLASEDSPVAIRLFVVCQPAAVPERILRDAFSRFGNLIDVYLLSGRNFGYAKYTNKDSAMAAMRMLHGQSFAGQRVKVMEAEPQKHFEEDGFKRQRTEQAD